MAINPRIGTSLASQVDTTTVVVVRWPGEELDLTCGGAPMVEAALRVAAGTSVSQPPSSGGTQLGKRYASADNAVELLCTKAGAGTLALAGTPLDIKAAKSLPVSD